MVASGARTNLKVGEGTGPARNWGSRSGADRRKKFLLVVPLHFFGSTSKIGRFGERFLVCCALLTVPAVPSHL